jgi:hypothetical protein
VSGGGEHRHYHQAAIFQLQTGPIPHSTPDVLDGGLEERRQKRRIALNAARNNLRVAAA